MSFLSIIIEAVKSGLAEGIVSNVDELSQIHSEAKWMYSHFQFSIEVLDLKKNCQVMSLYGMDLICKFCFKREQWKDSSESSFM